MDLPRGSFGLAGSFQGGTSYLAQRLAQSEGDLSSPSSIAMLSTSIKGGLSFGEAMSAQGAAVRGGVPPTWRGEHGLPAGGPGGRSLRQGPWTERKRKKRSKWHLGIRSRSLPHEIMGEVFAAMKALDMVHALRVAPGRSAAF